MIEKMPEHPATFVVRAGIKTNVRKDYAPPDIKALGYFGQGISLRQAQDLQRSQQVFIMEFGYPGTGEWDSLRQATQITAMVASETGGLIWDEDTRQIFSPEKWLETRLNGWSERLPDVTKQITIHAYKKQEYVRAITLGMAKFGLPDVVIEDFPWSMNRPMGNLINVFCQSLIEGAIPRKPGEFDLDLRRIGHPGVRASQLNNLMPNATGKASLSLVQGKWEEGDPPNRLVEIRFDRYRGPDRQSKQTDLVSSLFGWKDSIVSVRHTEELKAASNAAKAKLPELKQSFNKGLQPGEYLHVKAPFGMPGGGNEWMWVEVVEWKGDRIRGVLKNEPMRIPGLHGGQQVDIRQSEIFDYIHYFPNGSQEGNRTGEILEEMERSGQTAQE